MDETFERILVDHDGRRSVFSMGKLGILWELDRETGKYVRATDVGYQTQVDVDPQTGAVTYRAGMIQEPEKEISFCPTTGGVKTFRAMAYHPDTRALYVPLNVSCATATFLPTERREGGGGVGPMKVRQYHFHEKSPGQMGELRAMDVRTGATKWSQRRRAPYNTSALTTAGDLVFVGTWDRHAIAYDAGSGAPLWETTLPTMANGSPISYSVNGKQYVAFVAGASIGVSTWATVSPRALLPDIRIPSSGNGIFVFALPDR
jgi:alcohol dehydrogenase (cytochrome c)